MPQSVRAFAPASVSNLGCAFDILGFALERPGDEVVVRRKPAPGVSISHISGDEGRLPLQAGRNTAGVALTALLSHLKIDAGLDIEVCKKMPLSSGLGSSAASAVAALTAANALLGSPLEKLDLLPFALQAEQMACGAGHADNAAPSLLGGMVLIRSYQPLDVIPIPAPPRLWCSLVCPALEIRTEEARRILSATVPLQTAVAQWGNVAGLITGLLQQDYALIGRSLQDHVIEPQRAALIPGFRRVKQAALDAGALGCGISGSGPSLFALSDSQATARRIVRAMEGAFQEQEIESRGYVSRINPHGSRVL